MDRAKKKAKKRYGYSILFATFDEMHPIEQRLIYNNSGRSEQPLQAVA